MGPDGCALDHRGGGQPLNGWDERAIARLAGSQDGIVTLAHLTELGLSARARERRIREGRLIVVHRGVYAVGHGAVSERGQQRAAVWACGDGAQLFGLASARLLGLWERPVEGMEVCVELPRCPRVSGITIHRVQPLTRAERTTVDGIACTSVSRTIVDVAATRPARVTEVVFELAERRKLIRPKLLLELSHGRPGAPTLRTLLSTHQPKSGSTRSLQERRLLTGLRTAGLPEPVVNGELRLPELPTPIHPDLMWPDRKLLVELDSLTFHGTRTAMRRDRRRDRAATLNGWISLRFTWDDVEHDLPAVLADIATAHAAAPPTAPA